MEVQRKPHDVGNGLVCASFGVDGSLLSVGVPHPRAGLLELTGAPAFPVEDDGRVDLVRAHRAHLTDPATAFLRPLATTTEPSGRGSAEWRVHGDGWTAAVEADVPPGAPTVEQRYRLRTDGPGSLTLRFSGRVDRPGYAEITPGGPVPSALPPTALQLTGSTLRASAPAVGEDPGVTVAVTSPLLDVGAWAAVDGGYSLTVGWREALDDAELTVLVTMTGGAVRRTPRGGPHPSPPASSGPIDRIEAAATRYTLGCTALEVGDDECCILTDHRLLPLSWTRDAYYQAALLLAHVDDLPDAEGVVERHLTWLWRSGSDGGVWRRSHLSTGAVKDIGYQVDQQLFPLLELADFHRTTGRLPAGGVDVWGPAVRRVWLGLPRDPSGLVPGEENPADDPSDFPYLLSSQLLLAYTATRLAEIEKVLGLGELELSADADRTLGVVRSTFACDGPFGEQWAYEADGVGGYRLYQDANDVPTALAPLWGLCDAGDPQWRATMRFAFSEHNTGFVPGGLGGLGSAHTPGVWPLGDAQDWAVAAATGDRARADRVCERIALVASADGMLPETYDPDTAEWMARHWFGWPGALVGLLHATGQGRGPWVG